MHQGSKFLVNKSSRRFATFAMRKPLSILKKISHTYFTQKHFLYFQNKSINMIGPTHPSCFYC